MGSLVRDGQRDPNPARNSVSKDLLVLEYLLSKDYIEWELLDNLSQHLPANPVGAPVWFAARLMLRTIKHITADSGLTPIVLHKLIKLRELAGAVEVDEEGNEADLTPAEVARRKAVQQELERLNIPLWPEHIPGSDPPDAMDDMLADVYTALTLPYLLAVLGVDYAQWTETRQLPADFDASTVKSHLEAAMQELERTAGLDMSVPGASAQRASYVDRIGGLATRKKELPTALGSFLDGKALSQSDGEGESGEAQDVDNAEGPATPRGDSATQARRFGSFLEQIHGVYNRTDKVLAYVNAALAALPPSDLDDILTAQLRGMEQEAAAIAGAAGRAPTQQGRPGKQRVLPQAALQQQRQQPPPVGVAGVPPRPGVRPAPPRSPQAAGPSGKPAAAGSSAPPQQPAMRVAPAQPAGRAAGTANRPAPAVQAGLVVVEEDGEEQQEEEGVGAEGQRNGVRDAAPVANGKQQKGGTGRPPGRTRKNGSESTLPPVSYVGRQQPVRPQPSGSVAPTPHAARVLNQETARLRQLAQPEATMAEVREQAAGAVQGRQQPAGGSGVANGAGAGSPARGVDGANGAGPAAGSPARAEPPVIWKARRTARPVASPTDNAPDSPPSPQEGAEEEEDAQPSPVAQQQQRHKRKERDEGQPQPSPLRPRPRIEISPDAGRRLSAGAQEAAGDRRGSGNGVPQGIPALPPRRASAPSAPAVQQQRPASASPAQGAQQQRPAPLRNSNAANIVHRPAGAGSPRGVPRRETRQWNDEEEGGAPAGRQQQQEEDEIENIEDDDDRGAGGAGRGAAGARAGAGAGGRGRAAPAAQPQKRKRIMWSDEETRRLVDLYKQYGSRWAEIKFVDDADAHPLLSSRSQVDLKDKIRVLIKNGAIAVVNR